MYVIINLTKDDGFSKSIGARGVTVAGEAPGGRVHEICSQEMTVLSFTCLVSQIWDT